MGMWGMGNLYSSLAKKIKINPNQNSVSVYRIDSQIGEKISQLSGNYPIAIEPFVTDNLTFKKKLCLWMLRTTVRLGFLIKKNWAERWKHLKKWAEACVIPKGYQIAWSREWWVIAKYFVSQYLSVVAFKSRFHCLLGRTKMKPSPGRQSHLILAKI